jgi:hypothetical protein
MEPQIVVALIAGSFVAFGALLTFFATRGKTQTDAKSSLDARIDARVKGELERVYGRLDELEGTYTRKMSAVARILRAIADQWPDAHGPNLDPSDIAEIEDTIPVQWIRRNT